MRATCERGVCYAHFASWLRAANIRHTDLVTRISCRITCCEFSTEISMPLENHLIRSLTLFRRSICRPAFRSFRLAMLYFFFSIYFVHVANMRFGGGHRNSVSVGISFSLIPYGDTYIPCTFYCVCLLYAVRTLCRISSSMQSNWKLKQTQNRNR